MTRAYYKRWSLFYSLIRALNNFQTFNKNKPFMQKQLVVLACRGGWEGDFGRKINMCFEDMLFERLV